MFYLHTRSAAPCALAVVDVYCAWWRGDAESSGFSKGSVGYHTRDNVDSGAALEF